MNRKILEGIEIAGVRIKNRIVMPPMCTRLANPDGSVSAQLIEYYKARAG
jgi:2,4-dienoyl-CoA reductase-like NADH-dependent reductase (Old Yellow Enzyme family)